MACADAVGTQGQGEGEERGSDWREAREATTSQGFRKETPLIDLHQVDKVKLEFKPEMETV